MPPWNDNNFYTLRALCGPDQLDYFYDGAPRSGLPAAIVALDKEIDDLATGVCQQDHWVYSPLRYTDSVEYRAFQEHSLQLARPLVYMRQQLCFDLNRKNRLYASLPREILWWIYELAVGGLQIGDEIRSPSDRSRTLQLASVASYWRSSVIANPRLWASFRLIPSTDDEINGERMEGHEYFLRRTRNVPLHVHLVVDEYWGYCYDQYFDFLRQEAHRIRTLRIDSSLGQDADRTVLGRLDYPFPNAKAIAIHSSSSHHLVVPNVTHLRIDMPQAKAYEFHFQALTFLDITGVSWYRLRTILQSAVTLKKLHVRMLWAEPSNEEKVLRVDVNGVLVFVSGPWEDQNIVEVLPLVHTGLEELTINVGDVIQSLTLPNLKSLFMYEQEHLADFITRSGCQLVSFRVSHSSELDSLVLLDNLEHLHIESYDSNACDQLFHEFVGRYVDDPLEMLKSITLSFISNRNVATPPAVFLYKLAFLQNILVRGLDSFELYTDNPHEYHRGINDRPEDSYRFLNIEQAIEEQDPKKTPILIDGRPIRSYLFTGGFRQYKKPGRDRLVLRDLVLMRLIRFRVYRERIVEKILHGNWRRRLRLRIRRALGLPVPWGDGSWTVVHDRTPILDGNWHERLRLRIRRALGLQTPRGGDGGWGDVGRTPWD